MTRKAEVEVVHVLLIYSLRQGKLLKQELFDASRYPDPDERSEAATEAYFGAEREYREEDQVEIVLLASDSLASIHATHGSYFTETVPRPALEEEESVLRDALELLVQELAGRGYGEAR